MKNFLAIYMGTMEAFEKAGWNRMDAQQRKAREQAGMQAWMEWGTVHAAAIVDQGAPLGKTRQASHKGIEDIRNRMTGYVIIQAESHAAAAQLFENHPHFAIFPGESVEIMECLPMPTM
jgi:hypothetical protein